MMEIEILGNQPLTWEGEITGERAAWESQQEAANSKSPLGLLPTLACRFLLLLGLVSSTRKEFLPWRSLAGSWNIPTHLQLLRFTPL